MRIATYTRISTDEVNQPYSLGAQSERLASYVASQEDWELARHFTDQMSAPNWNGQASRAHSVPPGPVVSTSSSSTGWTGWPAQCAAWPRCWKTSTQPGSASVRPPSHSTPRLRRGG